MSKGKRLRIETSRPEMSTWRSLFKRTMCLLNKGHTFNQQLGKRSDLTCLKCGVIFFSTKAYRKGKR